MFAKTVGDPSDCLSASNTPFFDNPSRIPGGLAPPGISLLFRHLLWRIMSWPI